MPRPAFPACSSCPSRPASSTSPGAALYPLYQRGCGGLTRDSVALTDQLRYVDQARITGRLGRLTEAEFEPVRQALRGMFVL
ncbi:type II toxin-antitoxin system PemK/MazF family toxin [Deinococcus multiflagellatus]|uniref:Type II toxin-antitoxin system PemK/MazF family toxin n=1 Tax=Deinococcus multiflagellatus TaxID=1656887 RepID=A0ABW1ZRQ2_9DEIO